MFSDFEKAKTEASSHNGDASRAGGPETSGQLPPGVNEGDMENLEK